MRRTRRVAAWGVLGWLAVFVAAMAVAMARYPGGTWFDPQRSGHDFWRNFFSDLLHERALSGVANPAAPWAAAGMLALLPALGGFWLVLAATLRATQPRLARWVLGLGMVSLLGIGAVAFAPTDRFPALHGLAVVGGAVPALAAAVLGALGQWRAGGGLRRLSWLGAATLVCALSNLALYVAHQFFGAELSAAVPALQKLAALLGVVWLGLSAWRGLRVESLSRA